jgi:hypothetical protein
MRTLLAVLFLATPALAGGSKTFRVTSYKDFDDGDTVGTVVSSLGDVRTGYEATRTDVPEGWVQVAQPVGDVVYLGAGDNGAVYVWEKGKARKLASVEAATVMGLAPMSGGGVYAAGAGSGKVWAIDKAGKTRELAKLDAEHVWALVADENKHTLYAATGPGGKIFAIDTQKGSSRILATVSDKHALSMIAGDDALFVGTSDQALLMRVGLDGKTSALHDFEGDEVRAIARRGSTLYVAVNEITRVSSGSSSTPTPPSGARGTKMSAPSAPTGLAAALLGLTSTPATRDRKGKGAIFRVEADGRVEQLHALGDSYFTSVLADTDGSVWATSAVGGKVYRVSDLQGDRTVQTALDFPERQALAIVALPGGGYLATTGDAGAVYRVTTGPGKESTWTSKTLDAQFPSKFGAVRWSGAGALTVQTRSGNTAKPDATWTAWTAAGQVQKTAQGSAGHVASVGGRYLQVKVAFGKGAVLRDISVAYQPQNQRARVTEIAVGDDKHRRPHPTNVKIRWKVENPDDDELVYRVYFREESEPNWKLLTGPEPITKTEFEWATDSVPDGHYLVKVVASDERANPREEALEHGLVAAPALIDNKKPEVVDLKVAGGHVSGRARDSYSPLVELGWSIDGGDWQPLGARDGVLDDLVEEFTFALPKNLAPGAHSVVVRAYDAADNAGSAQATFTTP